MKPLLTVAFLLFFSLNFNFAFSQSAPIALKPGISINRILTVNDGAIRVEVDPVSGIIHYVLTDGSIYQVIRPTTGLPYDSLVFSTAEHGVQYVQGMTFFDSTLYVTGNNYTATPMTYGLIVRGKLQPDGSRSWDTLMNTVSYETADFFDHLFTGIVVSPNGDSIYVCSGARGDHGEIQSRYGQYPGLRNLPITTHIFSFPTKDTTITLQNDSTWLANSGYIYCSGVRSHFDMAFSDSNLFALENSGDRDHHEEMNWLLRDHHYGYPWIMGDTENPQQFPSFNPATDPLISKYSRAWRHGFWNNDPTFPQPPSGIVFTSSIKNYGPDCDKFRDTLGNVNDASDLGIPMATFTSHRSPLGLVFDNDQILGSLYKGDGFMLSWTKGLDSCGCIANPDSSIGPFVDPSQDLVHLDLSFDSTVNNFRLNATRIIADFAHPVDAAIDSNRIYVLEHDYGVSPGLYEVIMPVEQFACSPSVTVDIVNVCIPDSNVISIPAFGALPDNVYWFNSSDSLLRADTGLISADTILNLPEGSYYAVIVDGGACPTDTLHFSIPASLNLTIDSVTHTSCLGCSDGKFLISFDGGNSPYVFEINDSVVVPVVNEFSGFVSGTYIVCIIDSNGCERCDSVIVLDDPTGIRSIKESDMSIYPNPANDLVNIKYHVESQRTIKILDMNGRLTLFTTNVDEPGRIVINLRSFTNGVYNLEVISDNNRFYKKLIIIH